MQRDKPQNALFAFFLIDSLYSRHPNGAFRTHTGTRRARPRSVFNVRLFNGNLESFIKVLIASLLLDLFFFSFSYLFSVSLWLPGHLVGSPASVLAFDLSFYQQQNKSMFVC